MEGVYRNIIFDANIGPTPKVLENMGPVNRPKNATEVHKVSLAGYRACLVVLDLAGVKSRPS